MTEVSQVYAVEKSLVSVLLRYPETAGEIFSKIKVTDLLDPTFKFVFEAVNSLRQANKDWTWEVIADIISGIPKRPRSLEFPISCLGEWIVYAPSKANLKVFVSQLIDRRNKLIVQKKFKAIEPDFLDVSITTGDIYKKLRSLEDAIESVDGSVGQVRDVYPGRVWTELKKDILEIARTPFVSTGFDSLDDCLTWGFAPGLVTVITGRPSTGKSTLRSNLQINLSKMGIFNLVISKEQSVRQEYFRTLAIMIGLPLKDIIRVKEWKSSGYYDEIVACIKKLDRDWPHRMIDAIGYYGLRDVERCIVDCKNRGFDLKVVFIDVFTQLNDISGQLASIGPFIIQSKIDEAIQIAKEHKIHMCLIVQQRRMGKDREKLDMREYIKLSGSFEERGDVVLLTERPAYYKPDEVEDNCMRLRILKQRDGPTPVIELAFDPSCLRLSDSDSKQDSQDNYAGFDAF